MSIVSSESRSVGSSSEHHVMFPMIKNPCFSKKEVSNQVDLNPAPAPDPTVQEALWKAKSAECHACHELVPHKLLYVCRHRRCPGFFEPKLNYDEPSTFYANEKVFCSRCTFIGDHKRHADEMEEAQPIAMKMAYSNEERLIAFEKLAFLDQEDPVDFMVSNEFRVTELPVLAVDKYLLYAEDVIEWKERKQKIDDLKTTVEQCRLDGSNFARECAEKALITYYGLLKTIEDSLKSNESKQAAPPVITTNEEPKTVSPSENHPKNEVDETTVRMLCRNLVLRFDQVRDEMRIEEALQVVSDKLHEASGTVENKLAAARMFREKNNVALYYPKQ
ncbi:hypothetical protein L5515_002044 [Caenorhabditis briggsae]|uniref:Uncharacterized protein n=1 Tax=Caenorhabditis briggsae TaxID=6238 RepID=A0AAE9E5E4_CAEBR|nr:hypothetical protein L5515_002044 [Caenorhabditis briggsae]